MRRIYFTTVVFAALFSLTGCEGDQQQQHHSRQSRYGYQGTETEVLNQDVQPTPNPAETTTTTTTTQNVPPPPPPSIKTERTQTGDAPARKDYPYGTPVPGKPGFVTSPHAPYSGYVDVRGFPPGTEVKDPYTGKIFLVP